jgi:trigger factor
LETLITTIDDCTREIEITLTNDDLQPHYERAYREAQKEVEIKGFRKGKAPMPLIKQRFGRIIEQNSLDTIANDEFKRIVRSDNIKFVGQPSLKDIRKEPDSVTFLIRFEVIPDIELGEYRNLEIRKPALTVSDDEVQKVIDDVCIRFAKLEPAETAADNMHIVRVRFTPLDDETLMPIIGAQSEESSFFLRNDEMDDNLRALLLDTRVGDAPTFVEDAEDDTTLPARFRVTVLEINRVIPAEFNDETAQKYTSGDMQTAAELREDIVRFLERKNKDIIRAEMENQVVAHLTREHEFSVPDTLVRRVMQSMLDNLRNQLDQPGLENITVKDVDHEFRPRATEIARWQVLSDKIAEAEDVEIEDSDLDPYVAVLKTRQTKLNDTQLRNYLLQQESLVSEIFQRKTFDKIFEYAVVTEVSQDDYFDNLDAPFHPDDKVRQYFGSQPDDPANF